MKKVSIQIQKITLNNSRHRPMSIFIQIFPTKNSFIQKLKGNSELQTDNIFKFHVPKTGKPSLSFTLLIPGEKTCEIGKLIVPLQFLKTNAVDSQVFEMEILKKNYFPILLFATFHFYEKRKDRFQEFHELLFQVPKWLLFPKTKRFSSVKSKQQSSRKSESRSLFPHPKFGQEDYIHKCDDSSIPPAYPLYLSPQVDHCQEYPDPDYSYPPNPFLLPVSSLTHPSQLNNSSSQKDQNYVATVPTNLYPDITPIDSSLLFFQNQQHTSLENEFIEKESSDLSYQNGELNIHAEDSQNPQIISNDSFSHPNICPKNNSCSALNDWNPNSNLVSLESMDKKHFPQNNSPSFSKATESTTFYPQPSTSQSNLSYTNDLIHLRKSQNNHQPLSSENTSPSPFICAYEFPEQLKQSYNDSYFKDDYNLEKHQHSSDNLHLSTSGVTPTIYAQISKE